MNIIINSIQRLQLIIIVESQLGHVLYIIDTFTFEIDTVLSYRSKEMYRNHFRLETRDHCMGIY